jgi:glycosyltransferase involved in cell wall biosynthesis
LIEAMLNARPVIATSVGGVVDLLGTATETAKPSAICERGIRVNPDDADGFAAGLTTLIEDEALRRKLGERGRQFVEQNYARERLLKDITELYRDLLHRQSDAVRTPVGQASVC